MCAVGNEIKCRFCGGVGASCAPYTAIIEVPFPSVDKTAQKTDIARSYVCAKCIDGAEYGRYRE